MSAVIINVDTSLTNIPTINIGKQGENKATQVVFDVSEMIDTYGSGTAVVVVQRRGDLHPYELDNTSQSGDKVTWTVSNTDTAVYGTGRVQLFWTINDEIAKTVTYAFFVEEALSDPTDAPYVPDGGWISEKIGDLDSLTTTDKDNLVEAINEVDGNTDTNATAIGTLANLTTTEKSNLVGAINEVNADVSDVKEDLEALISRGTGLNDTQKSLIITILRNGIYSTDQSNNIDQLEDTFTRTVTSVSAVIDLAGNTIYTDDTLDTLRQYLTVTATFDDSTSEIVTGYSLSGTLTAGTSTITITYREVSSTFSVPVSQAVIRYTITNNLTGVTNSNTDTTIAEGNTYTGVLTAETTRYIPSSVVVTLGGTDVTSTAYDSSTYTITIPSVDGDITITATEAEDPTLPEYELTSALVVGDATDPRINDSDNCRIATGVTVNDNEAWTICMEFTSLLDANVVGSKILKNNNEQVQLYYGVPNWSFGWHGSASNIKNDYNSGVWKGLNWIAIITHEANSLTVNVYGTAEGTITKASIPTASSGQVYIGNASAMGTINRFALYKRVLTSDEITAWIGE